MAESMKWAREAQRWFKFAERTTQVLFHARGGGRLDWGLAAMGVAGMALEHLVGDDQGAEESLARRGFEAGMGPLSAFLCDLLRDHPRTERQMHQDALVTLWHDASGAPLGGAIYREGRFSDGPYLRPDGQEAFGEAIREVAWRRGPHLLLTTDGAEIDSWRVHHGRFTLDVLPPPGPYLGRQPPASYADRLRRYGSGPRTVLIRGASGVGKSVLAQHIATELAGPDARVLRIPASASVSVRPADFLRLVETLRPRVLLLDDLDVRTDLDGWLALLETLRLPDVLTIATQMTDDTGDGPGDWHAPGMRPGRIDEVFALPLPDERERREILAHYAARFGVGVDLDGLAAATEGLTGAWLGELVRRVVAHGPESWHEEVEALRRCAPRAGDPSEAPF